MDYNKRLKELQEEIDTIRDIQHNAGMKGIAKELKRKLEERATPAELKFAEIAKKKGLKLKFQHKINIVKKRRVEKFYFADFCDVKNKLIFEIDGGYHNTEMQKKKDLKRTRDLCKAGYKVCRITNEDVLNGKTTNFLVNTYLSIGIEI